MNRTPVTLDLQSLDAIDGWLVHANQGRQGALIRPIYEVGDPLRKVALVRFLAGSSAPVHVHTGFETIMVLSGSYQDEFGRYTAGQVVVYPPDSEHAWQSDEGATLFVVWDGPTEQRISVACCQQPALSPAS